MPNADESVCSRRPVTSCRRSGPRAEIPAMLCALALVTGCAAQLVPPTASPGSVPSAAARNLASIYEDSIYQAAVVAPGDALPLRPLDPGADGTFTVFTWAECRGTVKPSQCGSYIADQPVEVKWDIWATAGDEVRNKCKGASNLSLRIWQILGMPPDQGGTWRMVTLTGVQPANIFRPCTDPRTDTTQCNGTSFVEPLPPNAPPNFFEWFAKQAISSWQISRPRHKGVSYPWTRLGYSFDWDPQATSPYGASEYVIPGRSKPVQVMVKRVESAEDYCR
jgi:hypothetical protein